MDIIVFCGSGLGTLSIYMQNYTIAWFGRDLKSFLVWTPVQSRVKTEFRPSSSGCCQSISVGKGSFGWKFFILISSPNFSLQFLTKICHYPTVHHLKELCLLDELLISAGRMASSFSSKLTCFSSLCKCYKFHCLGGSLLNLLQSIDDFIYWQLEIKLNVISHIKEE